MMISFQNKSNHDGNKNNEEIADWEKLISIPGANKEKIIPIPIQIKQNKCIILPNKLVKMQNISIYNSSKNTLDELTKYPNNFPPSQKYTAAFDILHDILYFFVKPNHMITFNIITKKWNKMEVEVPANILTTINSHEYDEYTLNQSVISNGMFLIFTIHGVVMYDINTKLFTQIRRGGERYDFSIIHFMNTNEVWIAGGGSDDGYTMMSINEFMILKKEYKWARYEHELPVTLESFGCVLTMDQRYVLLFGGKRKYDDDDINILNDIYIMDVVTNIAYKSNIKCPIKQMFYACLMSDDMTTDIIIKGYIKDCLKLYMLNDSKYPSDAVFIIVKLYYYMECIHLFDRLNGEQWKIKIDPIINN